MTDPKIQLIEDKYERNGYRFRLVGGDAVARPGREAWCEIAVSDDLSFVGAFGGEVWPAAWPELFTSRPPTIYGQHVTTTERCRALLRAALAGR